MTEIPADPLTGIGLPEFARRLRAGQLTAEGATKSYLSRIAALDGRIGAFEVVDTERALAAARAVDALLAAGTDLGPLMGVPVAVKDILAVRGLPATGGSRLDLAGFIGEEGRFVARLRAAGCILLGKTRTVEFAFGAVGINAVRGTPWNPADSQVHRIPGGSSSGSATAVAAGLCALAVGSDTGGSVRVPAALCGVAGLKTSDGRWPRDGVLPLSPTFDTIGLFARSVEDLGFAFPALDQNGPEGEGPDLRTLRFGVPRGYYFDGLESDVARRVEDALAVLEKAGAQLVEIEIPEARERESIFPSVLGPELLAGFGRERFEREKSQVDPLVAARGESPQMGGRQARRRDEEGRGDLDRRIHDEVDDLERHAGGMRQGGGEGAARLGTGPLEERGDEPPEFERLRLGGGAQRTVGRDGGGDDGVEFGAATGAFERAEDPRGDVLHGILRASRVTT